MNKSLLIIFCVLGYLSLQAQNGAPPVAGARGASLGGVGAAFEDSHSVFANQAGMAFVDDLGFNLLAEQRFLLNAIRTVSAGGVLPVKAGSFGMTLQYYGTEAYNEQRISLAYGRKLMENFSMV